MSDSSPWLFGKNLQQDTRRETEGHLHVEGQLLGIESGVVGIRGAAAYWLVGPGSVLWLPPRFCHEARSHGAVAGWSLYVCPGACADLPQEPFLAECSRLLGAQAERLSQTAEGSQWSPPVARLAESFWDEFLSVPRRNASLPFPQSSRLGRVTEVLCANPADRRAQKDWAALAGLSVRSFVRHFTAETQMPFSIWKQRLRILNAQERLVRGETVTSVAFSVGYESLGAFAEAFKKNTGLSPSDYGKQRSVRHLG
ncbi:AraC family transcriptional regulator [Gluconobacter frateurii NBRC 101659]|uniref:AraC family transcriptional regulator n=1 Tax=Gluconobacter japonicus TaxID=376620 RepID=UPI00029A3140|nr:AraC family transcriptional regulator [Gluconobacter frateurii NBRC 101659]